MKKTLIGLCLLLVLSISVGAEDSSGESFFKAKILIDDDIEKNMIQIQDISMDLDFMQKTMLQNDYEKTKAVPVLLNILVPFGVGSFVQGDTTGGVTSLIGDLLEIGLITIGYINLTSYSYDSYGGYSTSNSGTGSTLIIAGGIVAIVNGIYKIARPISYANKFNRNLNRALYAGSGVSMKFIPGLEMTSSGDLKPELNFKVSF